MPRIPYGLDRLPRTLSVDDPRLPAADAGAGVLRLNSEPLPDTAMPDDIGDHRARVAAARAWLDDLSGDYARVRRQFVAAYFDFLAAEIATHRAALSAALRPYDGLYAPEDWLWSAPRPLPRAWLRSGNDWVQADIVFWDGRPLAVELSARATPREAALSAAGIRVVRIAPEQLAELGAVLPELFHAYWRGDALPASPFRRAVPRGVVTAT